VGQGSAARAPAIALADSPSAARRPTHLNTDVADRAFLLLAIDEDSSKRCRSSRRHRFVVSGYVILHRQEPAPVDAIAARSRLRLTQLKNNRIRTTEEQPNTDI
jgi:hypothetical protein